MPHLLRLSDPNPFSAELMLCRDGSVITAADLPSPGSDVLSCVEARVPLTGQDRLERSIREIRRYLKGHRVLVCHESVAPTHPPFLSVNFRMLVDSDRPPSPPAAGRPWSVAYGTLMNHHAAPLGARVDALFRHVALLPVTELHAHSHSLLWDFPHASPPEKGCPAAELHHPVRFGSKPRNIWWVCPLTPLEVLLAGAAADLGAKASTAIPSWAARTLATFAGALETYPLDDDSLPARLLAAKLLRGGIPPSQVAADLDVLLDSHEC